MDAFTESVRIQAITAAGRFTWEGRRFHRLVDALTARGNQGGVIWDAIEERCY